MYSSPFRHSTCSPKGTFAFDLHVLATPPAFDLSQDQTLHFGSYSNPDMRDSFGWMFNLVVESCSRGGLDRSSRNAGEAKTQDPSGA